MPTSDRRNASAELAATLRPSLLRLTRQIRNQRVDRSITLTHLATLSTLSKSGPMSPGELAGHERVQPPSMTKILAKLTARGLIDRAPHPTDKRQVIVSLSPSGQELVEEERQARDAWLSTRLAELSDQERDLLRTVAPLMDKLAAS